MIVLSRLSLVHFITFVFLVYRLLRMRSDTLRVRKNSSLVISSTGSTRAGAAKTFCRWHRRSRYVTHAEVAIQRGELADNFVVRVRHLRRSTTRRRQWRQ